MSTLLKLKPYLYPVTFLIAVASVAGSLYFSEVLLFAPCVLCWWQRVSMYPLVAISLIGIWRKDEQAYLYVLPFAVFGSLVSIYQNVLYYMVNWGFAPAGIGPCQAGISCTTNYITLFGFLTIPLMSLLAHLIVVAAMVIAWRLDQKKTE